MVSADVIITPRLPMLLQYIKSAGIISIRGVPTLLLYTDCRVYYHISPKIIKVPSLLVPQECRLKYDRQSAEFIMASRGKQES